jgi:hypothetical protein
LLGYQWHNVLERIAVNQSALVETLIQLSDFRQYDKAESLLAVCTREQLEQLHAISERAFSKRLAYSLEKQLKGIARRSAVFWVSWKTTRFWRLPGSPSWTERSIPCCASLMLFMSLLRAIVRNESGDLVDPFVTIQWREILCRKMIILHAHIPLDCKNPYG